MLALIEYLVEEFGYFGITILMLLENIFPPIPSEAILPLGGYLAAVGDLSLVGVILAGSLGALLGAYPWYYLGYFFNKERLKRLSMRFGRIMTVHPSDIDKASEWFSKHGTHAVFLGRFVPIFRTLISLPAGLVKMNIWRFTIYTFLGSLIWSTALVYAGYALKRNFSTVGDYIDPLSNLFILLLLGVYVYRFITFKSDPPLPHSS